MNGRGRRHSYKARGRGNGNDRIGGGYTPKKHDKEYKFHPHGSGKSIASFSQTLNEVILFIQKSWDGGKDIADTLEAREKIEIKKPKREQSKESEEDLRLFEQESIDMAYKEEYKRYLARLDLYERNLPKAFALIVKNYCTSQMVIRLKEIGDYEGRVKNQVLILLDEVEKIMNQPKRSSYPFISLAEIIAGMVNFKQNDLSVIDYKEEFKQKRALVSNLMGTRWLDKFVENTEEYDNASEPEKQKLMKEEAFEQFTTLLFMRGANTDFKETYDGFGLRYSKDKETNEYPKTMQQAVDIMATVKSKKKNGNRNSGRDSQSDGLSERRDGNERVQTSFAQRGNQKERRCFRCGDKRHISSDCPNKDRIPSGQWYRETGNEHFLNISQNNVGSSGEVIENTTEDASVKSEASVSWSGANICMQQSREEEAKQDYSVMSLYKNLLLLDTGSTHNMSCNETLVYDVKEKQGGWNLNANTGSKKVYNQSKFPGIDEAAMHSTSFLTNILSFGRLRKLGWYIKYNYNEDKFVVSDPNKSFTVEFQSNEDNLYVTKPGPEYLKFVAMKNTQERQQKKSSIQDMKKNINVTGQNLSCLQTLQDRMKDFSEDEIARGRKARKLYHAISAPDLNVMKKHYDQLCDNDVSWEDIVLAEKIFGWDISTAKGRWIKQRPRRVVYEEVQIPRELIVQNSRVELCIDLMFINNCVFLTAIDKTIPFRSCASLPGKGSKYWTTALKLLMRKYNQAGFFVKLIRADNEFQETLNEVMENVPDLPLVNHCSADEHVPEAERNNRLIQERFRIQYNRWPFKVVPRIMIRHLARRVCHDLNIFPNKKGISQEYSPYTIMNRRNFSVKRECKHEPGDFVIGFQDNTDQKNTPMPRGIECIYLNPTKDLQAGHELMNLQTGELLHRPHVKEAPMPEWVITRVEELGRAQGMKSLKFFNRKREDITSHDPDLETGVNWTDNNSNNNNYQNYNAEEDYLNDQDQDSNEVVVEEDQNEEDYLNEQDQDPNELLVGDEIHRTGVDVDMDNTTEEAENDDENRSGVDVEVDNTIEEAGSDNEEDENEEQITSRSGRVIRTSNDPLSNIRTMKGKSYVNVENSKKKEKVTKVQFIDEDSTRMKEVRYNFFTQGLDAHEYDTESAGVIASCIHEIKQGIEISGISFIQQFSMKRGLKVFGIESGMQSMGKEIEQLHKRNSFKPIDVSDLTDEEKWKAQNAIMLLTQKEGEEDIKSRLVYNGKETRKWLSREDTASPTVSLESINLTFAIDAHEERDVMIADVPNAFVQTQMPLDMLSKGNRTIMKIKGVLVDILYAMDPMEYGEYIVYEKSEKVLYLVLTKVLYGMLVASLLWYKKFKKDLMSIGFTFSKYDPCVAFRERVGSQHTIRFHVDDVASSHKNKLVNDKFLKWLNRKYGTIKSVKASRGDKHKYLGMNVDFSKRGCVKFEQFAKVADMVDNGPIKLSRSETSMTPAGADLMSRDENAKMLDKIRKEQFHNIVAKGIFIAKRSRPDIQPTIAVLATRVKTPSEADWIKMVKLLKYLNGSRRKCLCLRIDKLNVLKWYVDVSFGVHPDFKSHTGGILTMGHGAMISMSRKQKLNTRNTCEAELVGADDMSVLILWTKLFLEELGYTIEKNILKQDNKAAILLETNGRKSVGKRNRALNIRYFFMTDQIKKNNVVVEYCSTDEMIADFMTKPLQGSKFREFRKAILGED